eukprot:3840757-Pleurochrysis_carterae.AAC.1
MAWGTEAAEAPGRQMVTELPKVPESIQMVESGIPCKGRLRWPSDGQVGTLLQVEETRRCGQQACGTCQEKACPRRFDTAELSAEAAAVPRTVGRRTAAAAAAAAAARSLLMQMQAGLAVALEAEAAAALLPGSTVAVLALLARCGALALASRYRWSGQCRRRRPQPPTAAAAQRRDRQQQLQRPEAARELQQPADEHACSYLPWRAPPRPAQLLVPLSRRRAPAAQLLEK